MPTADPALEHRYNDDLLAGEDDRQTIKRLFPDIYHVLDHPELREQFDIYNRASNRAKQWVHTLGLLAIALAALALLSSAATPILKGIQEAADLSPEAVRQIEFVQSISIVLEILGLVGAAMALGGVWIAGWKKQWLECRLMTEKLRAWHFQMLIHRGKEIEESCAGSPEAVKKFQEQRAEWFADFMHHHKGKLDSQMHDLIEAAESRYTTLHEPSTPYPDGSPTLDKVFKAYKALRLKHQADYAAHKLQRETNQSVFKPHKWPINVLKDRLRAVTSFCLIGALLVSSYIVAGHFGHWPMAHSVMLPATILCLMVLNVATRGVMDGLAVREESQRYADYAGEVRYLLTKCEHTADRHEKIHLMKEMERAAVEELKSFLRAHSEARFVV